MYIERYFINKIVIMIYYFTYLYLMIIIFIIVIIFNINKNQNKIRTELRSIDSCRNYFNTRAYAYS